MKALKKHLLLLVLSLALASPLRAGLTVSWDGVAQTGTLTLSEDVYFDITRSANFYMIGLMGGLTATERVFSLTPSSLVIVVNDGPHISNEHSYITTHSPDAAGDINVGDGYLHFDLAGTTPLLVNDRVVLKSGIWDIASWYGGVPSFSATFTGEYFLLDDNFEIMSTPGMAIPEPTTAIFLVGGGILLMRLRKSMKAI